MWYTSIIELCCLGVFLNKELIKFDVDKDSIVLCWLLSSLTMTYSRKKQSKFVICFISYKDTIR